MTQAERTMLRVVGLFLLMQFPLVHCLGWVSPGLSQSAKQKPGSTKNKQSAPVPAPVVPEPAEAVSPPVAKPAAEGPPPFMFPGFKFARP